MLIARVSGTAAARRVPLCWLVRHNGAYLLDYPPRTLAASLGRKS